MSSNLNYQYAGNPYAQQVEPLDYTDPYAPTTKTWHGIALVVNGSVLGRVQSWNNNGAYTRPAEHVFELNNRTYGRPVDIIPGKLDGYTIAATLAEMWGLEIEFQTGAPRRYVDLISQVRPFQAQEFWFRGSDIYEVFSYLGCWMTDRNNQTELNVDANPRVISNFNFSYVSRLHTAGSTAAV
jgi:hypothetical protein